MILSKSKKEELEKSIISHFSFLYKDEKIKLPPIEDICKEVFPKAEKYFIDAVDFSEKDIIKKQKSINKTKNRWVSKELSADKGAVGSFYDEVYVFSKEIYEQAKLRDIQRFIDAYKVDTHDKYIELKTDELKEWGNMDSKMLTEFPYLHSKKDWQIKNALMNDIELFIFNWFLNEDILNEEQSSDETMMVVDIMTKMPVDPFGKKKIFKLSETKEVMPNVYVIDNDYHFESRLNLDQLESELIITTIKALNALDRDILMYLLNLERPEIYKEKSFKIEVFEIVKAIFKTTSNKSYQAVKDSLLKMKMLTFHVINKNKNNSSVSGFTSVSIFEKATVYAEKSQVDGKERLIADIKLSGDIINQVIKGKVIKYYKHKVEQLENSASISILYALQKERMILLLNKNKSTSKDKGKAIIAFTANLSFFRQVIYLSGNRKSRHIEVIEKALNEIVENDMIIERYERIGEEFTIYFKEPNSKELNDLFKNQTLLEEPDIIDAY